MDATTVNVTTNPLFVAMASVAATALVTLAIAAVRMVISLAQLKTEVQNIRQDILDIKGDPDVMRWSNYGRAVQAFQGITPGQGHTQ